MFGQKDVESKFIPLNEAFLVLSDPALKRKYDYCLSSSTDNDELLKDISLKREKAKSFIQDKLATAPKKKKRNKWPAILCGVFLLSALGTIMKTFTPGSNRFIPFAITRTRIGFTF